VRPAPHLRASLRRIGHLLETVAVLSLVPVSLGLFGVYAHLLGRFR
jgi:hypothetical protein